MTKWTDAEVKFLIDNYKHMTSRELAESLNRSPETVRAKLKYLRKRGLLEYKRNYNSSRWTKEELEILKFASDQIGLSIERKLAEIEIKASLDEKIVLLKEIHHRVKNNLQVISSLLYLQSKYLTDKNSLAIFLESQTRVRSMSLVHEKLYQSENLAKINLRLYVNDLVRYLFRSYQVDQNYIKMNLDVENIFLDVESAVPCGLIINELVSNSLKYAFPAQKKGEIVVKFGSKKSISRILYL